MSRWPRGIAAALVLAALAVACGAAPQTQADDDQLDGVRVQVYDDPRMFGKACLVFTHDTSQGASIAVTCP